MSLSLINHTHTPPPKPQARYRIINQDEVGVQIRSGRITPKDRAYVQAEFEGGFPHFWVVLEERATGNRRNSYEYTCQRIDRDGNFQEVFMKTYGLSIATYVAGSEFGNAQH